MELILGDVININGTLGCVIAQPQDLQYVVITESNLLYITIGDDDTITITAEISLAYIQENLAALTAVIVGHIDLQ